MSSTKRTSLTSLELRKQTMEALGWQLTQVDSDAPLGYSYHVAEPIGNSWAVCRTLDEALGCMPPIESSIAVAMEELEKLCKSRQGYWTLTYATYYGLDETRNHYRCHLCISGMRQSIHRDGATPAEAIALCILKALTEKR